MCRVYSRFNASLLLVLLSVFSQTVLSQSANELEELIGEQARQVASLQAQQTNLQTTHNVKKAELAPILNTDLPGKTQLEKVRSALMKAQLNYQQDSSEYNQSRLKNAEFKLALAERRFKKTNESVFTRQQEIQKLDQQITSNEEAIARVTASLASNRSKLNVARSAQLAQQRASEAGQQKAKASAAAAEILRLKAELEEQKRIVEQQSIEAAQARATSEAKITSAPVENQTTQPLDNTEEDLSSPTSLPVPTSRPKPTPTPPIAETSAPLEVQPKTVPATINETTSYKPKPKDVTRVEGSRGINLLLTTDEVAAYETLVDELASQTEGYSSKNRRIMTINPVVSSKGDDSRKDKLVTLIPVGNNIYRGAQDIDAGDTVFIVGFNRWRQSIPAVASDDREFVFIFNNSSKDDPRLVYFPQELSTSLQP